MKMLLLNVAIICCLFAFNLKNTASNAITIHLNNRKRISTEISYEKRNNKKNISIQFTRTPAYRQSIRQATTSNTNRRPLNISFEPFGHLKMNGLTHGKVNINLEVIKNAVTSITTGAISQLQNVSQYLPSFDYFQNDANEEHSDGNDPDPESSERHHPDNDDSVEEIDSAEDPHHHHHHQDSDKNGSDKDHSENDAKEDSDQKENDESDHQNEDDDNNDKSESKYSDQQKDHDDSETPNSQETQPEPGYLEKFQKYYSYAKPLAKAASMFVPGLGQYRQVMFGLEMVDLAYQTSLMYTEGKSMLSIGWFLGKEAFSRLGKRNEIEPHNIPLPIDTSTEASSTEMELFLDKVESTQYPQLDDEKENRIRQLVSETIDKYFHEYENLENETQRIRFIDLMTLCVKFIALQMANDEGKSS